MRNFGKINENNMVVNTLAIPAEQYHRGADYLTQDLGLVGPWIEMNEGVGIGHIYYSQFDLCAPPQPGPGWTLQPNGEWLAPPQPSGAGWTFPEGAIAWQLDVNQADETALDSLDGIGATLAVAIVAERTSGGPYASLEDISARVDGISYSTISVWDNAFAGSE